MIFTEKIKNIVPTFTDTQMDSVQNHLKTFTDSINSYIQTHTSNIMKTYLLHVVKLATKYINEKGFFHYLELYISILLVF